MILKLKVKYDDVEKRYCPTNVFLVDEFVNFYGFKPVLTEVFEYVKDNNILPFLQNKNEIHFRIDKSEDGYVNLGPSEKTDYTKADLELFVSRSVDMTLKEMFCKNRKRSLVIPRSVFYAGSMYFGKRTSLDLMEYGQDHATILNCVNKSLPSCMITSDPLALRLVKLVAQRYGDDNFVEYCRTFRSDKVSTQKTSKKYHGVCSEEGRFVAILRIGNQRVRVGTYETRYAAAKAYNNYIKENNIDKPLNQL